MPQFDVSSFSSQLFWLFLVFGCLYIIVSKIIAPKAENILNNRNLYLENNINDSEEYTKNAQYLKQLKQTKLEDLNADIEEIRQNTINILEENFLNKKKDLSLSLSKKTNESLQGIQHYINSFHQNEAKSSLDLASFIIEKITGKPADLKLLEKINGKK